MMPLPITWKLRQWRGALEDIAEVDNYVISTWRRSANSQRLRYDPITARRLLEGATTLWIAEHPDYEDVISGWLLASPSSPPVLHYLYVRDVMRRQGCAAALLTAAGAPRGELFTSVSGRIPPPLRDWFPRVTRVEPRLAFT